MGTKVLSQVFRDLVDGLEWSEKTSLRDDFLQEICQKYGLTNAAYLGVNLPAKNKREFFVHNTYSREWAERYESQNYVSIDPIVRRGLLGLMPVDWSDFHNLTPQQQRLFGEAGDFKVGRQGLTFPLHGMHNETAIFSVTADFSNKEWASFKRAHLREMRIAGDVLHQRILTLNIGVPTEEPSLTARELECLRWTAEGKTQQDVAQILGIAPRSVHFHLEGARRKLGCMNTTHAVATGLLRGLL